MSKQAKYQALPTCIIYVFIFLTILNLSTSQTSHNSCILDIQLFPTDISNCESGNWGGFINNNCCREAFDDYLYAMGRRLNLTGDIFLNSTEQKNCLNLMETSDKDVSGCGIQKLTSGAGGCSDYIVTDIFNKLGNRMKNLDEGCKNLSSVRRLDQACTACLRRWEEIGGSSDEEIDSAKAEANVCRFAVLMTLIGSRIDDKKWVQAVFDCLAEQPFATGFKEGETDSSNIKANIGNPISSSHGHHVRIMICFCLWIIIGGSVGIAVIVVIAKWIIYRKRTEQSILPGIDASDESLTEETGCLKIPVKEIYSATNSLSASNFIGQGVAGKVYKGILSNGRHVAVKHIIKDGYVETFVREVRSLSDVRHPNLVALLGFCEDKDECFLVYELCHNGNLSEWLYGKDRTLSWIQRLEVAIDSARGLGFLHTYPEGRIVHRDIKPTNILIDADFHAKLADFGLSKVMDIGQSYVSSEVRGTFGYVDPEYRRNHHVSASGDVYSFGMVLLQLISGQRVINLNINRPMPLNKMAKFHMRGGNISEFADPKLNGEYSVEAFNLVLELALSCTGLKQQRPSMEQVVLRLEKAHDVSNTSKISRKPFMDRN
ncbi:probable receptor-like serine/threonine-protein kinase At4g34500 [Pistacia vera]|uniref:probable receptor-like serine/threonine-protein kinase At4g34500 n=1 Tax=Pistacia vera TaxID=55513 RepID=UPI0012634A41|nr:probable receptor-like serine/threonine-protein kinase At4g34500 [Pistacia vera]XP_031263124.1 probable receptor-like serine/threonine-protein kinase At4g34500 [Pistacia vera]